MEIIIGEKAGFCNGSKNVIQRAQKELEKNEQQEMYCLGNLLHNSQVMNRLQEKGLKVINELSEIKNKQNQKVIFRAHGATKQTYEQAEKLGLEIIDLTCPNVLTIHKMIEKYVEEGYYIFLIGEKQHPETVSTASFCGENYTVIETQQDLDEAIKNGKNIKSNKLLVISQTTFSMEKYLDFVKNIEQSFSEKMQIEVKNTICQATKLMQEETEKLSKEVDYMIIIGGKKSANTNKLYDIACGNCPNAIMIESAEELTRKTVEQIRKYDKIGIMAGASTAYEDIIDIKNKIIK